MKRMVLRMSMIFVLLFTFFSPVFVEQTQAIDEEFNRAVQWMHQKGLTKYRSPSKFGKDDFLTREQAAKFFSVFTEKSLDKHDIVNDECVFSDALTFDNTLSKNIVRACELGLFKGVDGAFLAKKELSKAEALTVLLRALEGKKDENITPRWANYFWRAQVLGLTNENDVWGIDRPITRYEIALILYRASDDYTNPEELETLELRELLLQLGIVSE